MPMRSNIMSSYLYASYCDVGVQVRFWLLRSPLKKLEVQSSEVKGAIRVPSYANEVKGHVELFLCELL